MTNPIDMNRSIDYLKLKRYYKQLTSRLKVTESPHYWVVMRHREKAALWSLSADIDATFETQACTGWYTETENQSFCHRMRNSELNRLYNIGGLEGEHAMFVGPQTIGRLKSQPFVITKSTLQWLMASGMKSPNLCFQLFVEGQRVYTVNAEGNQYSQRYELDLSPWKGCTAHIEIVDNAVDKNGFLAIDYLRQVNE